MCTAATGGNLISVSQPPPPPVSPAGVCPLVQRQVEGDAPEPRQKGADASWCVFVQVVLPLEELPERAFKGTQRPWRFLRAHIPEVSSEQHEVVEPGGTPAPALVIYVFTNGGRPIGRAKCSSPTLSSN